MSEHTSKPETWRSLLSADELRAFDEGRYDNIKTAPGESAFIRRDTGVVTYNPEIEEHQPVFDEQTRILQQQQLEAVSLLAEISASCRGCGKFLRTERRVMVLTTPGNVDDNPEITVFCFDCYQMPPKKGNWSDGLSDVCLKVFELRAQNYEQEEIAAQLGISQSTVSRHIKKVQEARSK